MYKKISKSISRQIPATPKLSAGFFIFLPILSFLQSLFHLPLYPPPPRTSISDWLLWGKKGGMAEDYFVRLPYGINIFPRVFGIMGAGLRYFIPFDAGDQDEQVIKIFFVLFMGERVWFFTCELSARFKAFKGEQKL